MQQSFSQLQADMSAGRSQAHLWWRLTSVSDLRFLKRASGVRLVAATACPPATGVAVNLYCNKAKGMVRDNRVLDEGCSTTLANRAGMY